MAIIREYKEIIEEWYASIEKDDVNHIIEALGANIELWISEEGNIISLYQQSDTDLCWFEFTLHDCENREEAIWQLHGAIEMAIEDMDD